MRKYVLFAGLPTFNYTKSQLHSIKCFQYCLEIKYLFENNDKVYIK